MAALPFRAKIGVVCGNIALTNTDSTIGNSTVNVFSNSVLIKVANSTLSMNLGLAHYGLAVGTSVVNSTVLSTGSVTANTLGLYPQNNTTGSALGTSVQRFTLHANAIVTSDSITPLSNSSGTGLGSTTARWVITANSGNFSGNILTTGNVNGAIGYFTGLVNASSFSTTGTISGGAATFTSANVGANIQITTSQVTVGNGTLTAAPLITVANSTANVKIYPTAIQPGANAQAYAIGSGTQRVLVYGNTADFSGTITTAGGTIAGAGIYPNSNSAGTGLGDGTRRWILYANTISLSGAATLTSATMSSTLAVLGAITANGGTNPGSNTVGQALGSTTQRWNLTGNTISVSGTITASGNIEGSNVNGAIGYFTGLVNAAHFTTTGSANAGSHYALTGGMYPVNNTTGTALGSTTNRWVITANTGDFSGLVTSAGITSTSHVNTSTYFYAGANVYANTISVRVGNSTVNTEVGNNIVYVGNSSANAHVNSTGFFLSGSTIIPSTATTSAEGVIELATAAEYRANSATRALEVTEIWGSAANVTLTDAATIAVDMSTGYNFTVTLGASRTLGAPTNAKQGQSGWIHILNPSTYTLGYNAVWKFAGGTDPTLGTTSNNVLYYAVVNSTFIAASLSANVS